MDKLTLTYLVNWLYVCLLKIKLNNLVQCTLKAGKSFGKSVIRLNNRINNCMHTMYMIENII